MTPTSLPRPRARGAARAAGRPAPLGRKSDEIEHELSDEPKRFATPTKSARTAWSRSASSISGRYRDKHAWLSRNLSRPRDRMARPCAAGRPRHRPDSPRGGPLSPLRRAIDTGRCELIGSEPDGPALTDPWAFVERVLGWEAKYVAGAPGGPDIADDFSSPVGARHHASARLGGRGTSGREIAAGSFSCSSRRQASIPTPGRPRRLGGVAAPAFRAPAARHRRLRRRADFRTGRSQRRRGSVLSRVRLIYAPKGETSGHQSFPLRRLGTVAGRTMLGGLKLMLDRVPPVYRAREAGPPELLKRAARRRRRCRPNSPSRCLARSTSFCADSTAAEPTLIASSPQPPDHLYEGLLTVLMRLVFLSTPRTAI